MNIRNINLFAELIYRKNGYVHLLIFLSLLLDWNEYRIIKDFFGKYNSQSLERYVLVKIVYKHTSCCQDLKG